MIFKKKIKLKRVKFRVSMHNAYVYILYVRTYLHFHCYWTRCYPCLHFNIHFTRL